MPAGKTDAAVKKGQIEPVVDEPLGKQLAVVCVVEGVYRECRVYKGFRGVIRRMRNRMEMDTGVVTQGGIRIMKEGAKLLQQGVESIRI